jgi:hypothetical protein
LIRAVGGRSAAPDWLHFGEQLPKRSTAKTQKAAVTAPQGTGVHPSKDEPKSPERQTQLALATADRRFEMPIEGEFKNS